MYYKTTDEKVWFLDDVAFEHVLPEGCVRITEEEAKLLTAPLPPTAEENKQRAVALLKKTDWVNQPDVIDTSLTPHLLNHAEFITYRSSLRVIAVNPIAGILTWPIEPQEQWS